MHVTHTALVASPSERGKTRGPLPAGTLEDATSRVIRSRPASTIAAATGIPERMLHRYAAPPASVDEHRPIPSRYIAAITHATGRDDLIEQLARDCGGVFVRVAHAGSDAGSLLAHVSTLTAEFGDVQREVAAALADGEVTRAERHVLIAELDELIQRALGMRLSVSGAAQKPLAKAGARA